MGALVIVSALAGYHTPPADAAALATPAVPPGETGTLGDGAAGSHSQWAIVGMLVVGGLVVLLMPRRRRREQTSQ